MMKTIKEIQMELSKDQNDLIEMLVNQRIDSLVLQLREEYTEEKEPERIEAETVFQNLEADIKEKIDYLLTDISTRLFEEHIYIYKNGFADGFRIMREMSKLY